MNTYIYNGTIITASSKDEAIHHITSNKETPEPMTIKEAKEYKNFNLLEKKLNEICKRCEYNLPFDDHTYDIVKALKRNKNKIFEGYFKKYKTCTIAYFEKYINKIAKDIFNNGRFNSNVLASSNKYLYNGELITASSKQEAISKITASEHSRILKSRIKRWVPASYKIKDINLNSFEIKHPTCRNIVATEDYSALLDELRRYSKTSKFELSKGKESIIVTVLPLSNETKVTAFNKDTIRENTKLFFEDMNKGEFFYNYRIDKNFQDFIDNTLEDEIHDIIRSDKNLIKQCIEKRVANHSIVWAALYQIFEEVRKRWNLEAKVNNELIKNWFAYNDTDYKTALKKIVDNLTDFREELRESESKVTALAYSIDNLKIAVQNGGVPCKTQTDGTLLANGVIAKLSADKKTYVIKDRVSNNITKYNDIKKAANHFIEIWRKYNLA